MSCPFHKVRSDLPELTDRIAKLPVDERGYPIPFFVAYPNGKPDFRMTDGDKLLACVRGRLCWVCGERLGVHMAFAIGPMCVVNRTTSEPPAHLECAQWSVKACPFLSHPNMVRREDELTESYSGNTPGIMIKRNPGVTAIWVSKFYTLFGDGNGGMLIRIGDPESVTWHKEGRTATRSEVLESIESGLPALQNQCQSEDDYKHLQDLVEGSAKYLPL